MGCMNHKHDTYFLNPSIFKDSSHVAVYFFNQGRSVKAFFTVLLIIQWNYQTCRMNQYCSAVSVYCFGRNILWSYAVLSILKQNNLDWNEKEHLKIKYRRYTTFTLLPSSEREVKKLIRDCPGSLLIFKSLFSLCLNEHLPHHVLFISLKYT
jgi:hypothetical protein